MTTKRRWQVVLMSLLAIWLGSTAARGDSDVTVPKLALHETRLDNGLRVILVSDHSAPVYSINIAYNVGSRNELPGHTGFAHLFEHMMFQGSANVGKGEHFILVLNNGGNMNGTTSEDRTIYFEELPKNQLDLGMYLEADRMRSLNITQANLDNQRNAVEEERRQSIDNQPYGRAELDLDSLSYDNFAYKHPTIGSMADLDAASVADVAAFFHIYYAPNNAVLTLVGDFDLDEAMAKVKKYFASIPAQATPARRSICAKRRTTASAAKLSPIPWLACRGSTSPTTFRRATPPDNYAMQQLGIALAQGQSSRFYQHLVKDKQFASNVRIFDGGAHGHQPNVTSSPARGPA